MKYFLPAFVWSSIIFVLSVLPGNRLPKVSIDLISPDKLAHAIVYLILTLLLMWGYHRSGRLSKANQVRAVIISSVFGICMELVQYFFFPGRYFEVYDIIANIIGALISFAFIKLFIQ